MTGWEVCKIRSRVTSIHFVFVMHACSTGILLSGKSASVVAGCVNAPRMEINKTTSFDEEIRLDCENKPTHVLKVRRGKKGLGGLYNWDALASRNRLVHPER